MGVQYEVSVRCLSITNEPLERELAQEKLS
jgi:hypothetical protein